MAWGIVWSHKRSMENTAVMQLDSWLCDFKLKLCLDKIQDTFNKLRYANSRSDACKDKYPQVQGGAEL